MATGFSSGAVSLLIMGVTTRRRSLRALTAVVFAAGAIGLASACDEPQGDGDNQEQEQEQNQDDGGDDGGDQGDQEGGDDGGDDGDGGGDDG